FLHSHCSSCFQPLPSIHTDPTPIRYCSLSSFHIDYPVHFNSGEHHLFLLLQSHPTTWHTDDTSDLRTALRLLHHFNQLIGIVPSLQSNRIGGLLTNRDKLKQQEENDTELEEMVLCIVLTNAVEVQVNEKQGLGVAVYGPSFSWINHSCAPNACYRFSISGDSGELPHLAIKNGEEVSVAYTDLLQPKFYTFICWCRRCSALPPTYVDRILHGNFAANLESTNSSWDPNFCKDNGYEELSDCIDEIISEYLSTGNPERCCDKLEIMLIQSLRKEQLQSWPSFKLHPLRHLCLNAYVTLSSAYKIRASELLSSDSVKDKHSSKFSKLSRFSAAYSLSLAGAAHHLFLSESSLIVSAVHFWISAGESLLSLARSLIRTLDLGQKCRNSSVFSHPGHSRGGECLLMERFEGGMLCGQSQSVTTEVDWLETNEDSHALLSSLHRSSYCVSDRCCLRCERGHLFQLGVHCLLYGKYLATICYSRPCYLTDYVRDLLEIQNKEVPFDYKGCECD
ncbi:hypothetical protein AQUCO_01700067v1, partial [Aquilegia coerulea]